MLTFENLERATNRLLLVVPVALFLIFILLFTTFNSAKQALHSGWPVWYRYFWDYVCGQLRIRSGVWRMDGSRDLLVKSHQADYNQSRLLRLIINFQQVAAVHNYNRYRPFSPSSA